MRFFICGGGTGGHFFSGLALAELLQEKADPEIIFIGTKLGIEARTPITEKNQKIEFIFSRGLKGKGIVGKFWALLVLGLGILQSFFLLLRYQKQ